MHSKTDKGHSISFLDFRIMHMLSDGSMEFDVYKNKTHINKYLEMVRTLLNRAYLSPLCPERRMNQWKCFLSDLKVNGYPGLLRKCLGNKTKQRQ